MTAAGAGALAVPVLVCGILAYGYVKGVPVFQSFLTGAREGLSTGVRLLPTLVGLVLAVTVAQTSGLLELLCSLGEPLAQAFGVPKELLPLALLRPVSGSGASAYTAALFQQFGPDSQLGKMASVLSASTETTFYAVAVYFGAWQGRRLGITIPAALLGDMVALVGSVAAVKLFP